VGPPQTGSSLQPSGLTTGLIVDATAGPTDAGMAAGLLDW
jgi:hypothetical protein